MNKHTHTQTQSIDKVVLYIITIFLMSITIFILTLNPENLSSILLNTESNQKVEILYNIIVVLLTLLNTLFIVTIYISEKE